MSNYTDEIGSKLNDLLEKNYDAEKGYHKAAENVDNSKLKTFFKQRAQKRNDFGHQIKSELASYNQDIDKGGSVAGTMHRAWMDVKSVFSSDNEESMLEEVIKGEKSAAEEYETIINECTLPTSTRDILMNQCNQIKNDLSKVKRLEDLHD